jgi:hypothetical protein
MIRAERTISIRKALLRICFDRSSFFSPKAIENKGAPPRPTKKAKEDIKVVIGEQTPKPTREI